MHDEMLFQVKWTTRSCQKEHPRNSERTPRQRKNHCRKTLLAYLRFVFERSFISIGMRLTLQVCLRSLRELINCMRGKDRNKDLKKPSNQPRIHPTFYVGHTHELWHTRVCVPRIYHKWYISSYVMNSMLYSLMCSTHLCCTHRS